MSIQTAVHQTPDDIQAAGAAARKRILINQGAGSIFVQVEQPDGSTQSVPLSSLPPVQRGQMIQKLMTVPNLQIPFVMPAPQTAARAIAAPPVADEPASSGKAPSRYTTRTKRTTTSAAKKATKKK